MYFHLITVNFKVGFNYKLLLNLNCMFFCFFIVYVVFAVRRLALATNSSLCFFSVCNGIIFFIYKKMNRSTVVRVRTKTQKTEIFKMCKLSIKKKSLVVLAITNLFYIRVWVNFVSFEKSFKVF